MTAQPATCSRFRLLFPAAIAVAALVSASQAFAHGSHSMSQHAAPAGCSDLKIRFDDRDVERSEETITISRSEAGRLALKAAENGGIDLSGWDRDDYAVTACKVAAGDSPAEAAQLLGRVSLSRRGSQVTVEGPEDDDWVAFLIVKAPRGADLTLEAENGPVSLRDVQGSLKVKSVNGPVQLSGISGELDVEAVNGPVTIDGGSGTQRVRAENGPLTVRLAGNRWDGAGLDARTENGPVNVKLPGGYSSGVEVSTSSHSPVHCRAAGCPETSPRARWEEKPHRFQLGSGETTVRISTVNGPLSVNEKS